MPPTLLAAGSNARGQLATGTTDDAHKFTLCHLASPLPEAAHVVEVACGANHTLLLLDDTESATSGVWGSGDGSRGQLGTIVETHVFTPLEFPASFAGYRPVHVASAWETSYIVLRGSDSVSDVILSFGANDAGDLGREHRDGMHAVELCPAGETLRVRAISAGPHHVLVVAHCLSEGSNIRRVFGWGASRHGQLGVGQAIVPTPRIIQQSLWDAPDSIVSVACGSQHSLLLRSDGTVEGLGSNRKAQLTSPPDLARVRSIACSWNTSYALSRADVIHAWGSGNHGQLATAAAAAASRNTVTIGSGISRLACGSEHIIVLGDDGTTLGWGWNEHGNLGLGHTQDVHEATSLQASTSAHSTTTRAVGVWAGCGTSWLALA